MEIFLDNYVLSSNESLFMVLTTTGGTLVERHWSQSYEDDISDSSIWGHRIIAIIEAVPLLGGVVALIEIIFYNCMYADYDADLNHISKEQVFSSFMSSSLSDSKTDSDSDLDQKSDYVARQKEGELPTLNGIIIQIAPLTGPKNSHEGMKVRSFCLELLSNIEDLHKAKKGSKESDSESVKLELDKLLEIREVVRYFLEQGALQRKAGFADFTNFMNILAEGAKECIPIFQRYFDLVELQDRLPHKEKAKSSRWSKIRTMVLSGLFVKTLDETAEYAKKIGFHPIPALPEKQTIVNLYPTLDAINMLDSNHREAGRWLMHHTRVLTFRELCKSLKASCEQLRESILKWDNYYFFAIKGKSQEWMVDLAYRFFPSEKLPAGILSLNQGTEGQDLFKHLVKSNSNNFIFFDDGAYSASQFYFYLASFYSELNRNGPLKEKKQIYFIFGHFPTKKHKDAKLKQFEEYNVSINIITNIPTKNCRSLMDEENQPASLKRQVKELASMTFENPQIVTEWKTPDLVSTCQFVTESSSYYNRSIFYELTFDNSAESPKGIHDYPITMVNPPYKKITSTFTSYLSEIFS